MSFAPVTFSPSQAVTDLAAGLAASLENLKEQLTEGAAALGQLDLPLSGPGDLLDGLARLREAATAGLSTAVKFMAITPFQYGVGTRKGEQGFLTPEQALGALVSRFSDAGDGADGGEDADEGDSTEERAIVGLLIASPTQAMLGQALEAFNKVYPIAQLEQACRRAKALATLETDKFVIPKAPGFPPWGKAAPQKDPKGQAVAKALGGMVAAAEGAAKSALAPVDMLADFAKKQAEKLAQKAADLQALAESMTGGFDAWVGFSLQAPAPALFRYLSKLPAPFDPSCKCVSLLLWYGKPEEVRFYKESFGL